jgi:hypothetical protein
VVRAPGCCRTAGAFRLHPTPWRSALWGRISAGKEGAQGHPKKSPGLVVADVLRVFGVPLRGRLPVLDWCPFARLAGSLLKGHNEISKSNATALGQRPKWRRAVADRFY